MPHRLQTPPGVDELELMCDNARRVAALCDLLEGDILRARDLIRDTPPIVFHDDPAPDGAWILPEEG